ncbi:MAG: hypothetical protein ACH255_07475 [Candidatus Thiodiazotropha sp.]
MKFPKFTVGAVLITALLMAMSQLHAHFYFDLSPVKSGECWRLRSFTIGGKPDQLGSSSQHWSA